MSKIGDTMRLVKKAKEIQRELKNTEIEAVSKDGQVKVVFNGEQHIKQLEIAEALLDKTKKWELERELINVIGQAISKSQAVAAEQMKAVAGDLNLPGF
ncbi:MAG: YbaB/EbfC family nucleoid-associated protein [bacterium]|nr:YbaB/EbfC family nucleoid-associated protein [bacterium]